MKERLGEGCELVPRARSREELQVDPDPSALGELDVDEAALALATELRADGRRIGTIGSREVLVRMRPSASDWESATVATRQRTRVPLSSVAKVRLKNEPVPLYRAGGRRVARFRVVGSVDPSVLLAALDRVRAEAPSELDIELLFEP